MSAGSGGAAGAGLGMVAAGWGGWTIVAAVLTGAAALRAEPGILDFESAIAGDPLMDIAKALFYFTAKDEPKKAGLLAGYGALDRKDWHETLDLYRLYASLELWCWMAQIGNREPLVRLAKDLWKGAS